MNPLDDIDDIDRLRRINAALVSRVERSMEQQGNAFTLFQTAINLESRVRKHTEELRAALRRLEQTNVALLEAKEGAELANQSKTRFLAAASHDILQPLNAAHLSISALAEVQTTDEGKRLAAQVERALVSMEDLLRTLLDISKLDAGVVRPDIGDVAVQSVFQSLLSDFQPQAQSKGLALRFRPTDAVIQTDRTMFRRILQNVISNALRYTQSGGVLVAARRRGARVQVNIIDTGIGIPADQREVVYEEFHRGSNARGIDEAGQSPSAGLGLGLSIVRRLVTTLGHDIDFRSTVGHGTSFAVLAPASHTGALADPGPTPDDQPRAYGLDGSRVLLVENDAAVRQAMSALLLRWRCEVRAAATCGETLRHLDDGWRPDIVIADQNLDLGDLGLDTIDRVREVVGRAIPAMLITADSSSALARAARQAGFELVQKPVKPAELRALMAHLLA